MSAPTDEAPSTDGGSAEAAQEAEGLRAITTISAQLLATTDSDLCVSCAHYG